VSPSNLIENSGAALGMIKDLESKKAAIAALYTRWEELDAVRAASAEA